DLSANLPGGEELPRLGRCRHRLAGPGPQAQIAFKQISRAGMITRRRALGLGAAFAAFPARAAPLSLRASDTSLRGLAAAKGILFGSAAATYEFRDADFARLLPREAAIL